MNLKTIFVNRDIHKENNIQPAETEIKFLYLYQGIRCIFSKTNTRLTYWLKYKYKNWFCQLYWVIFSLLYTFFLHSILSKESQYYSLISFVIKKWWCNPQNAANVDLWSLMLCHLMLKLSYIFQAVINFL